VGAQLSIPVRMRPIRFLFASRPLITGQVLGIVNGVITTHLLRKAGYSKKTACTGAHPLRGRAVIARLAWLATHNPTNNYCIFYHYLPKVLPRFILISSLV
jgi:hypothetical protein